MTTTRDYNRLNRWLPAQIAKTGLPLFKVANRAGISRAAMYAWMADKTRPDSDTLLKVVRVLAELSGQKSSTLFAEGLSQYVNRPEGRRTGEDWAPAAARARTRGTNKES